MPGTRLYGIVDCARDPRLHALVQDCPQKACLFAGQLEPVLEKVSPWLVALGPDVPLETVWKAHGRGRSWGILVETGLDLASLRRHLRQFLQARLPDGEIALFRFYDPRVWRAYWPSLTQDEQARWTGPGVRFIAEPEPEGVA